VLLPAVVLRGIACCTDSYRYSLVRPVTLFSKKHTMKLVKLGLISIVVLFIIITAISSLLPSHILVSRAVDVHGNTDSLQRLLFHLDQWQNWMSDAKGNKGAYTVGADGTLDIGGVKITRQHQDDSTLVTQWGGSNEMKGTIRIIHHQRQDSLITVQWQMEQGVAWYPWEKFASITKDEIWGASMEKSLDNLKQLIESR